MCAEASSSKTDSEFLVLSCSLNPHSKSAVLCQHLTERIRDTGAQVTLLDLRETPLPFCGAPGAREDANTVRCQELVYHAQGIIVGGPVYNYDLNAAAKNFMELTGSGWTGKVVAFACSAGGQNSYMAPLGFMNSLMLDFRSVILPRYLYATGSAFNEGGDGQPTLNDPEIRQRLDALADACVRLTRAVSGVIDA